MHAKYDFRRWKKKTTTSTAVAVATAQKMKQAFFIVSCIQKCVLIDGFSVILAIIEWH